MHNITAQKAVHFLYHKVHNYGTSVKIWYGTVNLAGLYYCNGTILIVLNDWNLYRLSNGTFYFSVSKTVLEVLYQFHSFRPHAHGDYTPTDYDGNYTKCLKDIVTFIT